MSDNEEFKVGDKVEWDYPFSQEKLIDYGIIEEIWITENGENYMDILEDWNYKAKVYVTAKKVNGKWMVYKGYTGYVIPLRYRSDL